MANRVLNHTPSDQPKHCRTLKDNRDTITYLNAISPSCNRNEITIPATDRCVTQSKDSLMQVYLHAAYHYHMYVRAHVTLRDRGVGASPELSGW